MPEHSVASLFPYQKNLRTPGVLHLHPVVAVLIALSLARTCDVLDKIRQIGFKDDCAQKTKG